MRLIERLGLPESFRRHGWTALFGAVTLVLLRIETTDFSLRAMRGRTMGWATAEGFDVATRTGLVASSLAFVIAAFLALLLALGFLRRRLGEDVLDVGEGLSIAGLALWLVRAHTLPVWSSLNVVLGLLAANVAIGALDRFVFRVEGPRSRAAWLASLAIAGLGAVTLHDDFRAWNAPSAGRALDWVVGLAPVPLHALLRLATWRRDPARRAAALSAWFPALPWVAWLPLTSVLREELYLSANNAGVAGLTLDGIQAALLFALAAAAALATWRARRAAVAVDLERVVARRSFPWAIAGVAALTYYRPWTEVGTDLFEPANSGLFVQQWFDFGRVPFVETFDAHGLADSFWGFVWRALHGMRDETWNFYEFADAMLLAVVLYATFLAVTRSAWIAVFTVVFLPLLHELVPLYCGFALTAPFVLRAVVRRGTASAWAGLALFHAFLFLWRLDLGAAALAGSAGSLLALAWLDPAFRPRWRALVGGPVAAAAACAAAWFAVCAARGVRPFERLRDLAHVVDSSQGFSAPVLASEYGPLFHWHHFVFPLAVLALLAWVLARQRGRIAPGAPRRALVLTLVFGCVYYFANLQRGLVRHTFLEMGNVYLSSFAFLVLGLTWFLREDLAARTRAVLFLATAVVLGGSFGLAGPLPKNATNLQSLFQRFERRLSTYPRQTPTDRPVDRSAVPAAVQKHHIGRFLDFAARHLRPDETFLDLSNSPMLYVLSHRRSPHWLNHLFLAHDEHLQRTELAEFERHRIPFVLVQTEPDLAERDGVEAFNEADGVPNSFRHYLFREWLHPRYEPLCIVQRWQVWGRRDWTGPAAPEGTEERRLLAASGPLPAARVLRVEPPAGGAALAADRQPYVRIAGSAPRDARVRLVLRFAGGGELARELELRAGERLHVWMLPALRPAGAIAAMELDARGAEGFALEALSLADCVPTETQDLATRVRRFESLDLFRLPWLWAQADGGVLRRPVLRELEVRQSALPAELGELAIEDRTGATYERGIQRDRPGILLESQPSARLVGPGARVVLARSGEREVQQVWGRRVLLDGPPLDPAGDGAPHTVRVVRGPDDVPRDDVTLSLRFEPLPDPAQPCYVHLRLRSLDARPRSCSLAWGRAGALRGRFVFQLVGAGPQDYLLRVSSQASWALEACDWLELGFPDQRVEVDSVRLLLGD